MADVIAIIPARLGSTRFPQKVLYPYKGKPLLYYVWDGVRRAKLIDRVVVATDSTEIMRAVEAYGGEAVRTKAGHRTGSDRAAEVVGKIGGEIIVNVQGDNFGLKGSALDKVIAAMQADAGIEYATLARPVESDAELADYNLVKVVKARSDSRALWFSRAPIPHLRDGCDGSRTAAHHYLGHIGIYFFRRDGLMRYAGWRRTDAEKAESLEQLRILENGGRMLVYETKMRIVSVDAPEDVKQLDSIYK